MLSKRASGVLLHITSLPSAQGIGDFGPEAYRFADFLAAAGQHYWQVLPLNPPAADAPYDCLSAFAGNIFLISPERLAEKGYLEAADLENAPPYSPDAVDFPAVKAWKNELFQKAFNRFQGMPQGEFERFCTLHAEWLDDYANFIAIRRHFDTPWNTWAVKFRDRDPATLRKLKPLLRATRQREKFLQFIFFQQWADLKEYCRRKFIQIIGDLPIYVAFDSADVWAHPEMFKLGRGRRPRTVSGVPPDMFNPEGQFWGNPIYDWERLRSTRYAWWMERFRQCLRLYDLVRIDHFRGLVGYWEIPAGASAREGHWVEGPGYDFFDTLYDRWAFPPIIAEDLGQITPDVRELKDNYGMAGMNVLLFSFSDDPGSIVYRLHNLVRNAVIYTGTHDTNTVRGWFADEAKDLHRQMLYDYLGLEVPEQKLHGELIRMALMSVCRLAIIPMQDLLGLGSEARMNTPGTNSGNWRWRMRPGVATEKLAQQLRRLVEVYQRF